MSKNYFATMKDLSKLLKSAMDADKEIRDTIQQLASIKANEEIIIDHLKKLQDKYNHRLRTLGLSLSFPKIDSIEDVEQATLVLHNPSAFIASIGESGFATKEEKDFIEDTLSQYIREMIASILEPIDVEVCKDIYLLMKRMDLDPAAKDMLSILLYDEVPSFNESGPLKTFPFETFPFDTLTQNNVSLKRLLHFIDKIKVIAPTCIPRLQNKLLEEKSKTDSPDTQSTLDYLYKSTLDNAADNHYELFSFCEDMGYIGISSGREMLLGELLGKTLERIIRNISHGANVRGNTIQQVDSLYNYKERGMIIEMDAESHEHYMLNRYKDSLKEIGLCLCYDSDDEGSLNLSTVISDADMLNHLAKQLTHNKLKELSTEGRQVLREIASNTLKELISSIHRNQIAPRRKFFSPTIELLRILTNDIQHNTISAYSTFLNDLDLKELLHTFSYLLSQPGDDGYFQYSQKKGNSIAKMIYRRKDPFTEAQKRFILAQLIESNLFANSIKNTTRWKSDLHSFMTSLMLEQEKNTKKKK